MRERRTSTENHRTGEVPTDELPPGRTTRVEAEYGHLVMRKAARDDVVADEKDLLAPARRVVDLPTAGGAPLDQGIATSVERTTGASVSEARVHTGTLSAEVAAALGARAFTVGSDIHLGVGESPTDARLMTHEATHTIQQGGARGHAQTKLEVSQPGDALEREADGVAEAAAHGRQASVSRGAAALLQRDVAAKDAAPKAPPPIEHRSDLGVNDAFKLFDAQLDRTTQTLTLIVRIQFLFVPSNANQPWPNDASKLKFVADFKRQVETFWSNRFLLVPEGPCNDPVRKYHARVRVEPVQAKPHNQATVKWVEGHKQEASNTNSYEHTAELHSDDNQADPVYLGRGVKSQQVASVHEFGHMLGLHHINEAAAFKNPGSNPYGDTMEQQLNIMGMGDMISGENYLPFTTAMTVFTGCPWTTAKE